jgi:hypothetical protein
VPEVKMIDCMSHGTIGRSSAGAASSVLSSALAG